MSKDENSRKNKSWASIVRNKMMKRKAPPSSDSLLRAGEASFASASAENIRTEASPAVPLTPSPSQRGFWRSFSSKGVGSDGDIRNDGVDGSTELSQDPSTSHSTVSTPTRSFWKALSSRAIGKDKEEKKSFSASAAAAFNTPGGDREGRRGETLQYRPELMATSTQNEAKGAPPTLAKSGSQTSRRRITASRRRNGEGTESSILRIQKGAHNMSTPSLAPPPPASVKTTGVAVGRDPPLVEEGEARGTEPVQDKVALSSSAPPKVDSFHSQQSISSPDSRSDESEDEKPPQATLSLPRYMSPRSGIASGKSLLDSLEDPSSSDDDGNGNAKQGGALLTLSGFGGSGSFPSPTLGIRSPTAKSISSPSPVTNDPEGDALKQRMNKLMGSINTPSTTASPSATPYPSPVHTSSPASSGLRTPLGRDRPNLPRGNSGLKPSGQSSGVAITPRGKPPSAGATSLVDSLQGAASPSATPRRNDEERIGIGSNQDEAGRGQIALAGGEERVREGGGRTLGGGSGSSNSILRAAAESGNKKSQTSAAALLRSLSTTEKGDVCGEGTTETSDHSYDASARGSADMNSTKTPSTRPVTMHPAAANLSIDVSRYSTGGDGSPTLKSSTTSSHGWASASPFAPRQHPSPVSPVPPVQDDPDGDALRLKISKMMGTIRAIQAASPTHSQSPSPAVMAGGKASSEHAVSLVYGVVTRGESEGGGALLHIAEEPPSSSSPFPGVASSPAPRTAPSPSSSPPPCMVPSPSPPDRSRPATPSAEHPLQVDLCLSISLDDGDMSALRELPPETGDESDEEASLVAELENIMSGEEGGAQGDSSVHDEEGSSNHDTLSCTVLDKVSSSVLPDRNNATTDTAPPSDVPLLAVDLSVEDFTEKEEETPTPCEMGEALSGDLLAIHIPADSQDINGENGIKVDSDYAFSTGPIVDDVNTLNAFLAENVTEQSAQGGFSPRKLPGTSHVVEPRISLRVDVDIDTESDTDEDSDGDHDIVSPSVVSASSPTLSSRPVSSTPLTSARTDTHAKKRPTGDVVLSTGKRAGGRVVRFDQGAVLEQVPSGHRRQPTPFHHPERRKKAENVLPKPTKSSELRATLAAVRKNTPAPVAEEDPWVFSSSFTPPQTTTKMVASSLSEERGGAHQHRFTEIKSSGIVRELAAERSFQASAQNKDNIYNELISRYNITGKVTESTQTDEEGSGHPHLKDGDALVVVADNPNVFSTKKNPPIIIYNSGTPLGPPGDAQIFVTEMLSSVQMATKALMEREVYAKESIRKELEEMRRTREELQKKKYEAPKRAISEAVQFVNDLSGDVAKAIVRWDESPPRDRHPPVENAYAGVLKLLDISEDESSDDELYRPRSLKIRTIKSSQALKKETITPPGGHHVPTDAKHFVCPAHAAPHSGPYTPPLRAVPPSPSKSTTGSGRGRVPRRSRIPVAVKRDIQRAPSAWTPSTPASSRAMGSAATSTGKVSRSTLDCPSTSPAPASHHTPTPNSKRTSPGNHPSGTPRRNIRRSPATPSPSTKTRTRTSIEKCGVSSVTPTSAKTPLPPQNMSAETPVCTSHSAHTALPVPPASATVASYKDNVSKESFKEFLEADRTAESAAAAVLDAEVEKFFTLGNLLANTESVTGSIEKMKRQEKQRPGLDYSMEMSTISFGDSFTTYRGAELSMPDASLATENPAMIYEQEAKQAVDILEDASNDSMSMFYYLGNVFAGVSSKYPSTHISKTRK